MENRFINKMQIRVDEVDVFNRMRIDSILKYFQEAATIHAQMLGNGREDLVKHDSFWVLSRISLRILVYPTYEQEIILSTWPSPNLKFMFPRNYLLTNVKDEPLIEATSIWTIMNIKSRSVNFSPSFIHFDIDYYNQESITTIKVTFDETIKYQSVTHKILYSDLDINQHVNNVSYLRWAYDLMRIDYLRNHIAKQIDINYLNELTADSQLQLDYYFDEQQLVVRGVSNQVNCFVTKITWEVIK
jgi:acyl-ACP thioesterase